MTDVDEKDRVSVNHTIESRDHGPLRMRFSLDPDTTRRLQRLQLDPDSEIPWWRKLLRRIKEIW